MTIATPTTSVSPDAEDLVRVCQFCVRQGYTGGVKMCEGGRRVVTLIHLLSECRSAPDCPCGVSHSDIEIQMKVIELLSCYLRIGPFGLGRQPIPVTITIPTPSVSSEVLASPVDNDSDGDPLVIQAEELGDLELMDESFRVQCAKFLNKTVPAISVLQSRAFAIEAFKLASRRERKGVLLGYPMGDVYHIGGPPPNVKLYKQCTKDFVCKEVGPDIFVNPKYVSPSYTYKPKVGVPGSLVGLNDPD